MHTRLVRKKWKLYSRRSKIGEFRKRLVPVIAMKGGHVEQLQATVLQNTLVSWS